MAFTTKKIFAGESKTKILTVGINPSKDEFPNDSFARFPAWKSFSHFTFRAAVS